MLFRSVLRGLPGLARFTAEWLFRIRLATRKLPYTLVANADGSFPLEFNSEQTPDPSNRITLREDRDRQGLPLVHIAWRVGEHSAVVWKRLYFSPEAASFSAFGVWQGPPKALDEPNPASSSRISNTFGAPSGGRSGTIGG